MIGSQGTDLPVLTTARLRLEPLVVAHAESMFDVLADPALHRHLDRLPPPSFAHLRADYARLESRRSPDGGEAWLNWIVVVAGAAIGFVQATVLADTSAWIAYLLARSHHGRGYATEATGAMLEHLAAHDGVTRFQATVEVANTSSIGVLERLDFREAREDEVRGHALTETERLFVRGIESSSR